MFLLNMLTFLNVSFLRSCVGMPNRTLQRPAMPRMSGDWTLERPKDAFPRWSMGTSTGMVSHRADHRNTTIELGRMYDSFRNTLLRWAATWVGRPGEVIMLYLFLLPDLIRLMVNLLADTRVFLLDKLFVAGVLLYVISPIDLFPEVLIGPFGLVEDLILCLAVLYRLMSNPQNTEAILEHWKGDKGTIMKIQRSFQQLKALMMKGRRRGR